MACREGMRSLGGLLLVPPPCSGSRASLRHCGEGLRPRLQRAGERQLRRSAEIWHSSSPRRLLSEPWRAGLLSWGSSSLRRVMAVGEYWKTSSGSSSSSRMEGRGFSGAAPLSGRGCRRVWGGQGWSRAGAKVGHGHPCPVLSTVRYKPVVSVTAVGTGSSGRAPAGKADDAGSAAHGTPAAGRHGARQVSICSPLASQCPQNDQTFPWSHASALSSSAPFLLSILCCSCDADELPDLGVCVLSWNLICTPIPNPGSAQESVPGQRAPRAPAGPHLCCPLACCFCTCPALFAPILGSFIPLLGDGQVAALWDLESDLPPNSTEPGGGGCWGEMLWKSPQLLSASSRAGGGKALQSYFCSGTAPRQRD